ncbi:MAG: molybdopterin cofactor-binding domain-containing protein, partial [Chloroflexota bacterium]
DALRLRAEAVYRPATVGWAFAAHVATVDLDTETATARVVDYVAAYDNARLLDVEVVDEQMIGGIVQGISGALAEDLVYDEAGQLLTLLPDYSVTRARDCPPIRLAHRESLTTLNPLGVKGVGESPIVGPAAAIGNALADALSRSAANVTHAPFTPARLHSLLTGASSSAARGAGNCRAAVRNKPLSGRSASTKPA